jgi:hypothetical protein
MEPSVDGSSAEHAARMLHCRQCDQVIIFVHRVQSGRLKSIACDAASVAQGEHDYLIGKHNRHLCPAFTFRRRRR